MSIASLFRPPPAAVVVPGGRHAAPETDERPAVAPDRGPGRHACPEDDEPASDVTPEAEVDGAVDEDEDLLAALGFAYEA